MPPAVEDRITSTHLRTQRSWASAIGTISWLIMAVAMFARPGLLDGAPLAGHADAVGEFCLAMSAFSAGVFIVVRRSKPGPPT